jgi:hypothetical protein
MKAVVTDADALGALRPLDIVAYLRSRGWKLLESEATSPMSEWSKDNARGYFEVQVPKHQLWRDYSRCVRQLLSTLADEEDRSQLELIRDIPYVSRDVIRLRSVVQGRSDGSIPLEDGAIIAQVSRGIMLAAACAAVEPRRAYHTRKYAAATAFLNQLSLGQTEQNSFVLTLFTHIPPSLQSQTSLFDDEQNGDEPFNRKVTRTLATALTAISLAAESGVSTGELAAFEDGVSVGVSADLCEALALANDCTAVSELGIRIGWASARIPNSPPKSVHTFAQDELEVIREAGRVLRERTPEEDFELEGFVVDVGRPGDPLSGRTVIQGPVRGKSRKVRVTVADDDWHTANGAMENRLLVRCRGELVHDGKQFVLRNPRGFRLAPAEE